MNSETPNHESLGPPQQEGEIGRLGPYRVLGRLGSGGFGEVFRAQDTRLKRTVALKLMKPKFAAIPISRKRFIEEARSMAAVHHDNVATIFEVGLENGVPFMAMELLKGQSLAEAMKEKGVFPWQDVLRIAKEVCLGLSAAHQSGLIHRDVKPGNIWLEQPSGRAKILDFGLAIAGGGFEAFASTGVVVGSPGYLAPEQARNDPLDDRTDLYSLGVVLFVMCSGRLPLSSNTISGQLIAIICHPPRPLGLVRPDVPGPLCDLIHRLLHKEARDRPCSAAELVSQIEAVEQQCAVEADPALQIVTEATAPRSKSLPNKNSQKKSVNAKELESAKTASRTPVWIAGAACLIGVAGFMWWLLNRDRVANTPVPVTPRQEPPTPTRVTASSLQPLNLLGVVDGTRTTTVGQAARYRVQISNDAQNSATDPRRVNSDAKVAAQLVTLLKQPGEARVRRPTFPKKILVSQLPRPGETRDVEIQFLTNNLPATEYELEIQLQSPDGVVVATTMDRLTLEENLQESDLLGFQIVRSHQGDGADTYVQQGITEGLGSKGILQGHKDGKSNEQHIYLRFDGSRYSESLKDCDRAGLLLTVAKGGHAGRSKFTVYGIEQGLDSEWKENGAESLTWDNSPCQKDVGGQKYLGQISIDNTKESLKDSVDQVRLIDSELDAFVRRHDGENLTFVLIPQSTSNRPIRFHSKEGNPEMSAGLAIRFRGSSDSDDQPPPLSGEPDQSE